MSVRVPLIQSTGSETEVQDRSGSVRGENTCKSERETVYVCRSGGGGGVGGRLSTSSLRSSLEFLTARRGQYIGYPKGNVSRSTRVEVRLVWWGGVRNGRRSPSRSPTSNRTDV